jgi:hypothetical protein
MDERGRIDSLAPSISENQKPLVRQASFDLEDAM